MTAPEITVVVPSHGRRESIEACLGALSELDYPRDRFEVVVVDDGSPVPLESRVERFRDELTIRSRRQSRAGPAAARNAGLALARGELVAFTGDDCRPRADWLRTLAARFDADPETGIGGRIENALTRNLYSTSTDLLIQHLYDYYNTPPDEARFFTPNNLAFPVAMLRELGGFRSAFHTGEDRELCHRWRGAGHRLVYAPEVVVRHVHPLNLRSFWALHFRYGRGSCRFHEATARENPEVDRFEPLRFYLDLLRYPLSRFHGGRAVVMTALLGVAQVANAAGYLRQSLER